MDKIEVKILNGTAVKEAEKNMVFAARLAKKAKLIITSLDGITGYH